MTSTLSLFQAYGVELEYMIVDKDTLAVKPIADELLKAELGEYGSDFENGMVTWSNELVLHVVELKCTRPEPNLVALEKELIQNIQRVNKTLSRWNAMLLPSAAHPLMDPHRETKLWPHDNNEVYAIYNKIFDCRGHGWSNLQSTHLNLPFANDQEFGRLHAAIRLILPLLPALCASSPLLDGKLSGYLDTRLTFYKTNQAKIPSITGSIVPEPVYTEKDHREVILKKIAHDIAPYNQEEILDPVWVNSRGAMSRFDRGSIEIRIMDIQECPAADLAIVTLVIETLKALVHENWASFEVQKAMDTEKLAILLEGVIKQGQRSLLDDAEYLQCWKVTTPITAGDLWDKIFDQLIIAGHHELDQYASHLSVVLKKGTLADRLIKALGSPINRASIKRVYKELSVCLADNKLFMPVN